MSECCDPAAYRRLFDGKEAERRMKRYRRRGLDAMASRLVAYVRRRDLDGRSILEIGGGIGDLQIELLKAGAESVVNVELSSEYEKTAAGLATAEGLDDRIERRLGDFVEQQDLVEPADVVVLNRVICCYPWMERMMDASVSKTRWLLAMSVPRDRAISRLMVRVSNGLVRLRGCDFKSYVHQVAQMETIAAKAGLARVYTETNLVWQGMVFERVSSLNGVAPSVVSVMLEANETDGGTTRVRGAHGPLVGDRNRESSRWANSGLADDLRSHSPIRW